MFNPKYLSRIRISMGGKIFTINPSFNDALSRDEEIYDDDDDFFDDDDDTYEGYDDYDIYEDDDMYEK
jgi:hypothetical protein